MKIPEKLGTDDKSTAGNPNSSAKKAYLKYRIRCMETWKPNIYIYSTKSRDFHFFFIPSATI